MVIMLCDLVAQYSWTQKVKKIELYVYFQVLWLSE